MEQAPAAAGRSAEVIRLAVAFAALIALPLAPAEAASKAAPKAGATQDWTRVVAMTPGGGFRMGNPKAKVAILEYGSLTCPHCRHFAETALKPLITGYVRSGKASYEFRSFILNGIDVAATLVARCGGPAHFFPIAEQLYATQPAWVGKVTDDQQQRLQAMPEGEMMLNIARITGVVGVAASHGVAPARAEACAKSEPAAEQLAKMAQAANDRGVTGTPTFFINGEKVPAYDWATLEPFLKKAGG
jgi:protein-disulfide isomerase